APANLANPHEAAAQPQYEGTSGRRGTFSALLLRVVRRERNPVRPWSAPLRRQCLHDVRLAIRRGLYDRAESMLDPARRPGPDAQVLNLMGVICEARCDWKAARRWYGRAMSADRGFAPAHENMRRIYELYTFGRS